jgi:hypothetical protein
MRIFFVNAQICKRDHVVHRKRMFEDIAEFKQSCFQGGVAVINLLDLQFQIQLTSFFFLELPQELGFTLRLTDRAKLLPHSSSVLNLRLPLISCSLSGDRIHGTDKPSSRHRQPSISAS